MEFENQRTFEADAEIGSASDQATGHCLSSRALPGQAARIVPVVLSGGGGSRLWPFSTNETPKQFLPLIGSRSLFQEALDRVRDRLRFAAPIVVCNQRHGALCEAALYGEADARLVLEPCARNTAAAIAMAAEVAREDHGEDALILVMPSDHLIDDMPAFHAAISAGEPAARAGRLVTFGIRPDCPDTGYGYLHMGEEFGDAPGVRAVARFVEKPALELAEEMIAGGEHLWNAGIFLFEAATLLREVDSLAPAIGRCARDAVSTAARDGIRIVPSQEALDDCPSESIDYAVMEHSARVAVVPMSPGWSDLGSWDALAALVGAAGPDGPITALDCDGCFFRSDGLQVAALGVRDLIVVASGQRILILPRGRSQEVKQLLSAMDTMAA